MILGGDFGSTEMLTLSDEKVIGLGQGKFLNALAKKSQQALSQVQKRSEPNYFGCEKENTGRRNHRNHAFNHNIWRGNVEYDYRQLQAKQNRQLLQHLYRCVKELKTHCQKHHVSELVLEELNYSSLGRNKNQRQVFNLIKGFYGRLEAQNFVKLTYVNPAYTSQTCPCCGYVHQDNRRGDMFCCLDCGYSPNVKCSKADYVGALNIKARQVESMLRMSKQQVKAILMQRFELNKSRICNQENSQEFS